VGGAVVGGAVVVGAVVGGAVVGGAVGSGAVAGEAEIGLLVVDVLAVELVLDPQAAKRTTRTPRVAIPMNLCRISARPSAVLVIETITDSPSAQRHICRTPKGCYKQGEYCRTKAVGVGRRL
jgi:hypothetical protein